METVNIAGIMDDSIVDGPGIRVAIFVQGCPRRCEGCHNPESHPFGTGTDMTVDELFERVRRNPLARGVTLSGYEVASYTGYTFEQLCAGTAAQRALLDTLDVLVDGEFVLAKRNLDLRFRGSENQRILDVPKSLAAGAAVWYDGERWTGGKTS